MNTANINTVWASLIIEELVRNDIDQFMISPGSRNSPLVVAVAQHERAKAIVHPDERGAAFFALGYARASGRPAVLISTSGTAAANYFPAVIEVAQSFVPLIILSADRPVELRDTSAHQTMDQVGLYGRYTRRNFDLPAPTTEIQANFVLTTIDQAVYQSRRQPCGAVQINCQFREPLAPQPSGEDFTDYLSPVKSWSENQQPFTRYSSARMQVRATEMQELMQEISASNKGIMVVGPLNSFTAKDNILPAAQQLNMPVLVDVASGLRFGNLSDHCLIDYEYYLDNENIAAQLAPDLILHLGGIPRSKKLNHFLQNANSPIIHVNDTPARQDPFHQVRRRVEMPPNDFCQHILRDNVRSSSQLLQKFTEVDSITASELQKYLKPQTDLFELAIVRTVLQNMPSQQSVYLANSMPIRDADASGILRSDTIRVGVNFGVNGIDGTIASAAGFVLANQQPGTVILGDLALLHDLNSLQFIKQNEIPLTIIVLNNNGGGIFSFLPISHYLDVFESFFAAPHHLDFQCAARHYRLNYACPKNMNEFVSIYQTAVSNKKGWLIEVKTERESNKQEHQKIWRHISKNVNPDYS